MISENTLTGSGSGGAPTLTSASSTASRDRYASTSITALKVLRTRSKLPASFSKVSGSLVAWWRSAPRRSPSSCFFSECESW